MHFHLGPGRSRLYETACVWAALVVPKHYDCWIEHAHIRVFWNNLKLTCTAEKRKVKYHSPVRWILLYLHALPPCSVGHWQLKNQDIPLARGPGPHNQQLIFSTWVFAALHNSMNSASGSWFLIVNYYIQLLKMANYFQNVLLALGTRSSNICNNEM